MRLADKIREFVYKEYVQPARERGDQTVTFRAGDVHEQMDLKSRLPAVCAAVDTNKFREKYQVRLVKREGPANAANAFFTFALMPGTVEWEGHKESVLPLAAVGPLDDIMAQLRAGKVADSLIRLRQHIEKNLRERAVAQGVRLGRRSSAGHVLNVLRRRGAIPDDAFYNLRNALDACNKAAHSVKVSKDEAEWA
jgi:hypothetical protein